MVRGCIRYNASSNYEYYDQLIRFQHYRRIFIVTVLHERKFLKILKAYKDQINAKLDLYQAHPL